MTPEAGRLIDRAVPRWDFAERHARLVRASAPLVWRALGEVRVSDLPLTRLLMWARTLGRRPFGAADRRALHALPPGEVARDEGRELLLAMVAPTSLRTDARNLEALRAASVDELVRPMPDGWVRIAMDFRVEATDGSTLLTTETRVLATGPAARRRFRLYWLVIRGGSGLIRRELLHAVARRAERVR
jgi:hypothetical protein